MFFRTVALTVAVYLVFLALCLCEVFLGAHPHDRRAKIVGWADVVLHLALVPLCLCGSAPLSALALFWMTGTLCLAAAATLSRRKGGKDS